MCSIRIQYALIQLYRSTTLTVEGNHKQPDWKEVNNEISYLEIPQLLNVLTLKNSPYTFKVGIIFAAY